MKTLNDLLRHWRRQTTGRWLTLVALLAFAATMCAVDVTLPDATANTYETVLAPIICGDMTGQDVYAVYARISFDPDVVSCVGVDTTGALAASWGSLSYNVSQPGQMSLSLFDTTPLTGAGELAYLVLRVETTTDAATALTFENIVFNEGDPAALPTNGWLEVTNRRPWFDALEVQVVNEGETLAFSATAHDPFGLPISLDAEGSPAGAAFVDNGAGSGDFVWETTYTSAGDYAVDLIAANSQGFADTVTVDLLVREVLDVALPDNTAMPGASLTAPIRTTAVDGLDIYAAYCAVEVDSTVAHITGVNVTDCVAAMWGDPTYNIVSPGRVVISLWGVDPLAGAGALCNVEMQAVGELGTSTPLAFDYFMYNEGDPGADVSDGLLYVGPPNPVFEPQADKSIDEFETLEFTVAASDPLLHNITLSAAALPPGSSFDDNDDGTGDFAWSTDQTSAGDYTVSFYAENAEGWLDTLLVNIHVEHVPQTPVVVNPLADITLDMNDSFTTASMDWVFEDIDSAPTYTVSGNDHINAVLNPDNTWTLTPDTNWYGVETLYFTATDEADLSATDIVQVRVIGLLDVVEDFDHAGAAPTGWETFHSGGAQEPWAVYQQSGDDYCYRVNNPIALHIPNEKLRSPVYDFSTFHDVQIGFWHNFTTVNEFYITFQYSLNGFTWNTIASYTSSTSGNVNYDISALVDGRPNVRFQWTFVASGYGEVASWEVDDPIITGLVSDTTPPADITDLSETAHDDQSVTLAWTPVSDPHFQAYEVYVSTDSEVTTEDLMWSVTDDPLLQDESTAGTTVSGLAFNEHYWFAVRGVDTFGNAAELSNPVDVVIAFPPVWSAPWPVDPMWTASRAIEVGGTLTDDYTIDASTLQIRVDANGDGAYGAGEDWVSIAGYSNAASFDVRTMAQWTVDGDSLRYELRAQDTMSSGWAYSGFEGLEGPGDDWFVRIDTTPPTTITDLTVDDASATSVDLSWSSVTEPHFGRYEIYYATHELVTTGDALWSDNDDPALASIATTATTITGLAPDSLYWFAVRAVDDPGNVAALSAAVPGVPHSLPPTCDTPWPTGQPEPAWANSFTVEVGCTFHDWFGVDSTTVQARWDANGDGVYGPGEDWVNVYGGIEAARREMHRESDPASDFEARVNATYTVEGEDLAFELRAWDIHGFGPVYSGESNQPGIEDDWTVRIDTTPPADISLAISTTITDESIELLWFSSADDHFLGYEIWYATHEGVTTSDSLWNWLDDPNLANPGDGVASTIVTGLQSSTDYWFAVRAVDEAGNACAFAPEVAASTVSNWAPLAPQNLMIECVGSDVVLTWDPVTQNEGDEPITVSGYKIYKSDNSDCPAIQDNYETTVTDTTFTHTGVLAIDRIYYRVTAIQGALRETAAPQEQLLRAARE